MSGQVSRGSAGEYQADERAGVARLSWQVLGRRASRFRGAPLAIIRQMSGQVLRGSASEYQADEQAVVPGRRINAFELWFWRRLLRVLRTARRSNQSILKEISPGCSLEGLMLELKLQYFGHLMRRADSFAKTLMLGKIEAGGEGEDRG